MGHWRAVPLALADLEPYLPLIAADIAYGGYTMTIGPIELGSPIDEWALKRLRRSRARGGRV